jgi:hypothetical protein
MWIQLIDDPPDPDSAEREQLEGSEQRVPEDIAVDAEKPEEHRTQKNGDVQDSAVDKAAMIIRDPMPLTGLHTPIPKRLIFV